MTEVWVGTTAGIHSPSLRWRGGRRIASYLVTIWFLVTVNFALPRAMPGDPIEAMVATGEFSRGLSASERVAALRYYGLDRPLWHQYSEYLGAMAHGDLGVSIRYKTPVVGLLAERLPWTLLLGVTALAIGSLLGILAGIHAGWRRGGRSDRLLVGFFAGLAVLPPFFLASLMAFVFSVKLGWLPLSGALTPFSTSSGFVAGAADVLRHLVLPAAVGATLFASITFLITRAGMVTEAGADYLLLGRAKGASDRRLEFSYSARNSMLPMISAVALALGVVASTGIIFAEIVFSYPGIGRLLFDAIQSRDYPLVQGCFLLMAITVVTANLAADLLASRLDPRTRA